ncbi:S-layer protein [Candidatus Woesearchaeota archaeon]|nr:S-layer protein [Candidatus Woesearchaeota archaeon]
MFVVKKENDSLYSLPAKEISGEAARHVSSALALAILRSLAREPKYPAELAKELRQHEQKIYYHIRNLEKAKIIKVVKEESKQGAHAKYYALDKQALVLKLSDFGRESQTISLKNESSFLSPFIKDGKLQAKIIVGSPDPHGADRARSRDGYYGMDLALFLGTFLNYIPESYVKLDTEVRDSDLQENLILIGGPIVNKLTGDVNAKLPVRFDKESHYAVKSSLSAKTYPEDEIGVIVKTKSPYAQDKYMLVVAGKRHSGTRAAIIAFLKHFDELVKGNVHKREVMARIVEGVDLDSDGQVDDAEFRE